MTKAHHHLRRLVSSRYVLALVLSVTSMSAHACRRIVDLHYEPTTDKRVYVLSDSENDAMLVRQDGLDPLEAGCHSSGLLVFERTGAEGLTSLDQWEYVASDRGKGLLQKVEDVEVSNSLISVVTCEESPEVSLAKAVRDGAVHCSPGSCGYGRGSTGNPDDLGHEIYPLLDGLHEDFSGTVLVEETLGDVDTIVEITEGNLDLTPSIGIEAVVEESELTAFELTAQGEMDFNLELHASASSDIDISREVPLATWSGTYVQFIGIVPVVEVVTINIYAGFTLTAHGSVDVTGSVYANASIELGARWENGEWEQINEPNFNFGYSGPDLDIAASARLRTYLRADISVELYGSAGPTLAVEPYLQLDAFPLEAPYCTLSAGVDGNLQFNVHILDWDIASFEDTFPIWPNTELGHCADFFPPSCPDIADCTGYECGPDPICGEDCGVCDPGEYCNPTGRCIASCVPSCSGRECGDDGCGGSCGSCSSGEYCSVAGQCVAECYPDCSGRECGSDGCGGDCGSCSSGEYCDDGECEDLCSPDCSGRECGGDGCGGDCGSCPYPLTCHSGICGCTSSCSGRECGDDGCGGSCGSCGSDEFCSATGQCEPTTDPGCHYGTCSPAGAIKYTAEGCIQTCIEYWHDGYCTLIWGDPDCS